MNSYSDIDLMKTGKQIQKLILERGFRVCEIQKYLCLSCPQPIYRWFKGQMLPSVNHLYMLSQILEVHMEELLIKRETKDTLKK